EQHHTAETPYFSFFEEVRRRCGLFQRYLEVPLSGFPLTCRARGDTQDRLREAQDRPKRHCIRRKQLTRKRIELPGLRSLAQHEQTLDNQREHPPCASGVLPSADR